MSGTISLKISLTRTTKQSYGFLITLLFTQTSKRPKTAKTKNRVNTEQLLSIF